MIDLGNFYIHKIDKYLKARSTLSNEKYPSYIYYLRITKGGNVYYKLGISQDIVNRMQSLVRYTTELRAEMIAYKEYPRRDMAERVERKLHKIFKDSRYTGSPILHNANSELYVIDILGIEKALVYQQRTNAGINKK
jgi:hypothetical protein